MIYIIRHGQTAMNQAHVLQGRSNIPLNETGLQQAEEAGKRFRENGIRFSRVFSSPLGRALQTAQAAAPDVPIEVDERLIEMEYGPYEGTDLKNPVPEILAFFQDFANTPAPDGVEQLSEVVSRTGAFVEEIRELPGDILISTHAIAMKGILEYLTPESGGSYWSKYIANCEVYVTDYKDGAFLVPKPWES